MARGCSYFEPQIATSSSSVRERPSALRTPCAPRPDPGAEPGAQPARCGDVIGVDVRLQHAMEPEAELREQRAVALDLTEHGIDQRRLARALVAEQVAIAGGFRVDQLAEDHAGYQRCIWS